MRPEKIYSALNIMTSQIDIFKERLFEMSWSNEEERKRAIFELEKAFVSLDNAALKISTEFNLNE